jgi:ribosome biogenesis GTPase
VTGTSGTGVVLDGTGGVWHVRVGAETLPARLRGKVKNESALKLAVGDRVVLQEDSRGGSWVISEILPRKSQLARREPGAGHGERVLAANVDQVVIVFAVARPEPHRRMLDRFLVIAEGNNLAARIAVNKVDLADLESVAERFSDYSRAGYPLHLTSVRTGHGLAELRQAMTGAISVFTGPSGVGKSSLLNTMYTGLNLRVGEISESVQKGRHTTVGASFHALPDEGGGYVVDTPGLREVGMWGLPPAQLAACFPEFRPLVDQCRFGDCTHLREPGCAIRAAVKGNAISGARYDSYSKLFEELEEMRQALR